MEEKILLELKVINLQLNSMRRKRITDKPLDYYYSQAQKEIYNLED